MVDSFSCQPLQTVWGGKVEKFSTGNVPDWMGVRLDSMHGQRGGILCGMSPDYCPELESILTRVWSKIHLSLFFSSVMVQQFSRVGVG